MYVPLVINSLIGLLLGGRAYTFSLVYTTIAFVYFLVSTLKALVADSAGSGLGGAAEPGGGLSKVRQYFVYGVGALQILIMWWLGPKL